jgi:hypothetical protein
MSAISAALASSLLNWITRAAPANQPSGVWIGIGGDLLVASRGGQRGPLERFGDVRLSQLVFTILYVPFLWPTLCRAPS